MADLATRVRRRARWVRWQTWLAPGLILLAAYFGLPQISRLFLSRSLAHLEHPMVDDASPFSMVIKPVDDGFELFYINERFEQPTELIAWPPSDSTGWRLLQQTAPFTDGPPHHWLTPGPDGDLPAATWAWFEANVSRLPTVDAAFAHFDFWPAEMFITDEGRAADTLQAAARLEGLAAIRDVDAGRTAEGIARLRLLLRRMRGVKTSPSQYALAGARLEGLAAKFAALAPSRTPVAPNRNIWQALIDDLLETRWQVNCIRAAQTADYVRAYNHTFRPDRIPRLDEDYDYFRLFPGRFRTPRFFYDPWQTMRQLRRTQERLVAEAGKPRWKRDKAWLAHWYDEPLRMGTYNYIGAWHVRLWVNPWRLDRIDGADARCYLAATAIALRCYHDWRGSLPATLATLVDEDLLPAVPRDPFDGQPLRYDPDRRIIWSIGRDEHDDEARPDDEGRLRDLAVELTFAN